MRTLLSFLLFVLPALALCAEDPDPSTLIDPERGIVFGVPFGAGEDDVIKKFGEPSGVIRLGAKRTALLYGADFLLLFYEGKFDALRCGNAMIDWNVSRWLPDNPPFDQHWKTTNGLRPHLSLKDTLALLKLSAPRNDKYRLTWSNDATVLELHFSSRVDPDKNDADDAYFLHGFTLARKHDGKEHWIEPHAARVTYPLPAGDKNIIGLMIAPDPAGLIVRLVRPNSPADLAAIKSGDTITSFNGTSIAGMSPEDFADLVSQRDVVTLHVLPRQGDPREVTLKPIKGREIPTSAED